jgi:probable DNA metabolism protein
MELFDFESNGAQNIADAIDAMLLKLTEISPTARDNASHALLYGFSDYAPADPPLESIRCFTEKVLSAAEKTGNVMSEEARRCAEQVRSDRLDPDTERVQIAAAKVIREFDRLRGILRFKPITAENRYTAFCAPDHFVLPLLADHFWQRFGKIPWAIIDEKRKLGLFSENGSEPVLRPISLKQKSGTDEWESLWKKYHHSINNEDRLNPKLQKQFLPSRYWKYLTEV